MTQKKKRNYIKYKNKIYKYINSTILVGLQSIFNLSTKFKAKLEIQIGNLNRRRRKLKKKEKGILP
jgi:hypothetical protein